MTELERARRKAEQVAREKRRARQKRYRDNRKATREATLVDMSALRKFTVGVNNYPAVVAAIRRRMFALGMTLNELDALCGWHPGYCSHLLSTGRKHSRNIGMESLPRLLKELGMTMAFMEDEEKTRQVLASLAELRGSRSRRRAREAA